MPGETLYVSVPKLVDEGVVLVVSGHANNYLVNNVSWALVSSHVVKQSMPLIFTSFMRTFS